MGNINYKVCKYARFNKILKECDKKNKCNIKFIKYFNLLNDRSKQFYFKKSSIYKKYIEKYINYL